MIVYQVSCQVNLANADRWEKYFIETHLEDVFQSGCFTGYSFRKVTADANSVLFVSEYYCESAAQLEKYNNIFAADLKNDVLEKFEGQFSASRQVFEILTEKR